MPFTLLAMATTKRKQLEHRITEKLIAMSQTNDLDKIYQFYSELKLKLDKRLEVLRNDEMEIVNLLAS